MSRTHPLEYCAAEIGGVTARWLANQIRAGLIPARKIGRHWRMTDDDIAYTIDLFRRGPNTEPAAERDARRLSLTATSARRKRSA